MSDKNSPWGQKPGSGNNDGNGGGNSPWGNGGGQRPNRPQRPSRDNVIQGLVIISEQPDRDYTSSSQIPSNEKSCAMSRTSKRRSSAKLISQRIW